MARIASTGLVVALLAATAAAFALTQGLKLQPAPLRPGTQVDATFSPVCDCEKERARISFVLRKRDRVDVQILDGSGDAVRTIARSEPHAAGRVTMEWDGRDDAGRIVPEGSYEPRVHLDEARFTTTLPNPIRVDTTAPVVGVVSVAPRVFSPDGDGRSDRITVTFRSTEPARGMLFVDGRRIVWNRFRQDTLVWNGRVRGRDARQGGHRLRVSASDAAGNRAEPTAPTLVTLRYVALGRDRIRVAAGARFSVRVSSDAARVRWRLGRRGGFAPPGTLTLRAPLQKGRFTLVVTANGHSDRAALFVREPAR